jgi:hypothetical protein
LATLSAVSRRQLARALVAGGPIAARFGIYLGSRLDLFPGTDCLRLLEIPDAGPASDPARVAALFESELGGRPDELFEGFEPEPIDSGLLFQWHRARLPGGPAALVELTHPELVPALAGGEPAAAVERLIAAGELPAAARDAVDEFVRRLDLRAACLPLEELADDTADTHWLEVPRSCLRLCSPRIRVIEDPEGWLTAAPADGDAGPAGGAARAQRLARGWLALALSGRRFPAAPWGGNVCHLPNGRLALLGGCVHRLPRTIQATLLDNLAAVVSKRPARAARAFLDLLPEAAADHRLRDRLRHTDPFRDPGLDIGGDRFARQLLAHWRTATQLGHHPPDSLTPFYRGLFLLNQEARRLSPDTTPVRNGFREARLLLLFDELRDEAESGRWNGVLERQLSVVSGLPQKLDRILTLAAENDRGDEPAGRRDGDAAPRRAGGGPVVAACLLALTAVALVTHHLAGAAGAGPWVERLGGLAVLLLGSALLRAASRDGSG